MNPPKDYANLLFQIVSRVVEHVDMVSIELREDDELRRLYLKVHPDDLGKVIGKQGRTARSIRTILVSASGRDKMRIGLDINGADISPEGEL